MTKPMTKSEIAALRALEQAATQGEWMAVSKSVRTKKSNHEERPWNSAPTGWDGGICNCLGGNSYAKDSPVNIMARNNAALIAAMRNVFLNLMDEVERLWDENERLTSINADLLYKISLREGDI